MRIQGTYGVKPIECINSPKDRWAVRWDIQSNKRNCTANYEEKWFDHKPSLDEIKDLITDWYNAETEKQILTGFAWKDMPVWLSFENQFNYKAVYDMAVQTGGENLPVRFKFGTDEHPQYCEFDTVVGLGEFYSAILSHVQKCLAEGWAAKDKIDYSVYVDTE